LVESTRETNNNKRIVGSNKGIGYKAIILGEEEIPPKYTSRTWTR